MQVHYWCKYLPIYFASFPIPCDFRVAASLLLEGKPPCVKQFFQRARQISHDKFLLQGTLGFCQAREIILAEVLLRDFNQKTSVWSFPGRLPFQALETLPWTLKFPMFFWLFYFLNCLIFHLIRSFEIETFNGAQRSGEGKPLTQMGAVWHSQLPNQLDL